MANLGVNYMGLALKNPIIIGASNLVQDQAIVNKMIEAGAAAIVYKSLFEEQIQMERLEMHQILDEYNERHAEMLTSMPNIRHAGPEEHLMMLTKFKKEISIPVIGSLNAIYKESWVDFAKRMQDTGIDALELNFFSVTRDASVTSLSIEDEQYDILCSVVKEVKIPVSVKLSPFYANPLSVIIRMVKAGAKGVVLFNRLFQPDIDIDKKQHIINFNLSNPDDYKLALRYVGLVYGQISASICANSGIYTSADVIKMIMAGAGCVQIVSTVYKNQPAIIAGILNDINAWMEAKGYAGMRDIEGMLSDENISDPLVYKRAQYVDLLLSKSGELLNKYKQV